jgi:vacuolar protein sorting-associated protein VTA1
LFEVLSVFGEIDEDIKKRIKYAKWKAIYISKCLKNGETPIPGPVGGIEDEDLELYNFQPSNTNNTENTTNSFDNVNNKSEKVVPDSEPISSPSNVSSSATNQSSITAIS